MNLKRAFTLFLCIIVVGYIFYGPKLLNMYRINHSNIDEWSEKDIPWKGVITVWDYPRLDTTNGSRFGWIKSKIKRFEKENPGVFIEFRDLDWKEGPTLLKAAAKTGAYPDIAPVGSEFFFISKGVLEELDSYITAEEKADFVENALESATYNGKLYGIPWMMTGYTLLLNTDIFNNKNVKLPEQGNWTYEEFVEAMKQLTYDTNGKGGPDVFGFNSFIEPGYYNAFGIIMSDGAQILNPDTGEYSFDYPEAISGLTKLYDLKHKYNVTHPLFGEMSENEAWTSFLQGKVAVYTAGSWTIPYLRNMQGNNMINFTVANYPTGKAEIPLTMNNGTCSYAVFKQNDEAKKDMCIKFIKFLTSKDTQDSLKKFGYFPVRKSAKDLYQNDTEMYIIQKSLNYAEFLPMLHNWNEVDIVLQSRIKASIEGKISPEAALKEAKVLAEKYIQ